MMLTVIEASEKQIEKILKKHLPLVTLLEYSYDGEDNIGFVSCLSLCGRKIEYQWRRGVPMFFGIIIGGVRYDIAYPKDKLLKRLTELGKKAEKKFWDGAQI